MAYMAFRSPEKTAEQWFILGVAIGFAGGALDNLYWAIPWTIEYMHLMPNSSNFLFDWGALPNIFFRQIAGIIASFCHLQSYYAFRQQRDNTLSRLVWGSIAMSVVYFILLVSTNPPHSGDIAPTTPQRDTQGDSLRDERTPQRSPDATEVLSVYDLTHPQLRRHTGQSGGFQAIIA